MSIANASFNLKQDNKIRYSKQNTCGLEITEQEKLQVSYRYEMVRWSRVVLDLETRVSGCNSIEMLNCK